MAVFKCKMCGGTLEVNDNATVTTCEYCGTQQTLPRLDSSQRINLYDRANHFRRNNDFDKAAAIYEQILNEENTDAEAYWSLVLCRYGIEYVEDPATHKRVPTVNRTQFTSIFDDDNYKLALQYGDNYQRQIYEQEAKAINDIQKEILIISQKEKPFDVFLCYKETDQNGRRTPDSVLANDLYHQLTQENFNVFFARITLEDKIGTAYEPYIFSALLTAKVMVVLGTKPEYFNAVWVRNEWSRYLAFVKQSGGKKMLIPAYKDMDPYDLPEEFSHLQALDMSKLGFTQDLIRGIKKIVKTDKTETVVKETVAVNGNGNVRALLDRVEIFLEDSKWEEADRYCERILDQDPRNAYAYLYKLMAKEKVCKVEELVNNYGWQNKDEYKKVIRFGDDDLISTLKSYAEQAQNLHDIEMEKERNTHLEIAGDEYNAAYELMRKAQSESDLEKAVEMYEFAANRFKDCANEIRWISDSGFEDANKLMEICKKKADYTLGKFYMNERTINGYESAIKIFERISGFEDADELAEICRNDTIYVSAKSHMEERTIDGYKSAIELFEKIPDWKDSFTQISYCQGEMLSQLDKRKTQEAKQKNVISWIIIAVFIMFIIIICIIRM